MHDDISAQTTSRLLREARILEIKLIHDACTAIDTERYCLIQLELGSRLAHDLVLDPRD